MSTEGLVLGEKEFKHIGWPEDDIYYIQQKNEICLFSLFYPSISTLIDYPDKSLSVQLFKSKKSHAYVLIMPMLLLLLLSREGKLWKSNANAGRQYVNQKDEEEFVCWLIYR